MYVVGNNKKCCSGLRVFILIAILASTWAGLIADNLHGNPTYIHTYMHTYVDTNSSIFIALELPVFNEPLLKKLFLLVTIRSYNVTVQTYIHTYSSLNLGYNVTVSAVTKKQTKHLQMFLIRSVPHGRKAHLPPTKKSKKKKIRPYTVSNILSSKCQLQYLLYVCRGIQVVIDR